VASRWIEEFCADLYAVLLLGPAYPIAFIHFVSSSLLLDSVWDSHPPPRLRINNIIAMLELVCPASELAEHSRHFLAYWKDICTEISAALSTAPWDVVYKAIVDTQLLKHLRSEVRNHVAAEQIYNRDRYLNDMVNLHPLMAVNIPPVEYFRDNKWVPANLPGILNVGWEEMLSGLAAFRNSLSNTSSLNEYELGTRFNKFLMKAMELSEIRHAWSEVT
jgi:hypothetical protein